METIRLKLRRAPVGDAEPRSPEAGKPLFQGKGGTDYVCGHCGAVIAAGMAPAQHVIVDAATCSGCGAENEFPPHLRA